ncbi:response regulator [uncultured Kiloniella sp.]|uniref:response regulator n=1 Tax=uncultured Kiloniella sp. TaxID=1133091 RepID=UPI002623ED9B|nr:response regulator [uncultured Kiloniella sp.]
MDFQNLECCIVDDEPFIQRLIKSILSSLGVRNIRLARSGIDGFDLLEVKPADLIFIDWTMKPMSGLELIKKIRSSNCSDISGIPIIMLTAHSERKYIEQAVLAGANDYLIKPVSPNLLRKRIERIFKNRAPLNQRLGK